MDEPSRPAVAITSVRKVFADGTVALDDVDVAVERGTVTAIVGDNGSGKTTLLRLCAGLLEPSAGSVRVLGFDPAAARPRERARIGYVSQAPQLDPQMTGAETLALFAALYGVGGDGDRLKALARKLGLDEHWRRSVKSYSGGLRQRLHLAVGMVHEPELWLLDEPSSALDPAGRELVWSLMRTEAERGKTVVAVTHDLRAVAASADVVALLYGGKLLVKSSPAEIVAAHAGWTLRLELAARDEATALGTALMVAGVQGASAREREVSLDLGRVSAAEARAVQRSALDVAERQSVAVNALRLEPPDLDGAYFNLTGHALSRTKPAAAAGRGRGRGGRARDDSAP
ncbi:MAG TPA: ABC transporter ATP-binding protein [Polyangiaceae bacterium]